MTNTGETAGGNGPEKERGWRWWANLLVPALAIVFGAWVGRASAPGVSEPPQFADVEAAADVLTMSPGSVDISSPDVRMTGSVHGLPSDTQIWVLSRGAADLADQGELQDRQVGVDPQGPCLVESSTGTFVCDHVKIGTDSESGTYFVYVGLADSNVARGLVSIVADQSAKQDYEHPAPDGFKSLAPVRVTRMS